MAGPNDNQQSRWRKLASRLRGKAPAAATGQPGGQNAQEVRIPYEVYETIHKPVVQRRKRLALAALAVLALIAVTFALWQYLGRERDAVPVNAGVEQLPQKLEEPPSPTNDPSIDSGGAVNNGTVDQPR